MGRHAAPRPDEPFPAAPQPGSPAPRAPRDEVDADPDTDDARPSPPARTWWEHAVLAVVAALAVGGVMAWAGGTPWTAVLGGLGSAVVVLVAGWLAGRLPHDGAGPG